MATRHQVRCVNKQDRDNVHERITYIGGQNTDGKSWKISQERAIKAIEDDEWDFFVKQSGREVDVIVATSRYGHKYLKTVADGEAPNNLLSLLECV